jgi:hypothetical protein
MKTSLPYSSLSSSSTHWPSHRSPPHVTWAHWSMESPSHTNSRTHRHHDHRTAHGHYRNNRRNCDMMMAIRMAHSTAHFLSRGSRFAGTRTDAMCKQRFVGVRSIHVERDREKKDSNWRTRFLLYSMLPAHGTYGHVAAA